MRKFVPGPGSSVARAVGVSGTQQVEGSNPSQATLFWQPGKTLEDVERDAIIASFCYNNWNKWQTSKELGISYRTIRMKLEKYRAEGHVKF